jgi:hypothetical protein
MEMPTTTIATAAGVVFRFDGEVLEVFSYDDSRRIHVLQIASVETGGGFLGGSSFTVRLKQGSAYALQVRLQEQEKQELAGLAATVNATVSGLS